MFFDKSPLVKASKTSIALFIDPNVLAEIIEFIKITAIMTTNIKIKIIPKILFSCSMLALSSLKI